MTSMCVCVCVPVSTSEPTDFHKTRHEHYATGGNPSVVLYLVYPS